MADELAIISFILFFSGNPVGAENDVLAMEGWMRPPSTTATPIERGSHHAKTHIHYNTRKIYGAHSSRPLRRDNKRVPPAERERDGDQRSPPRPLLLLCHMHSQHRVSQANTPKKVPYQNHPPGRRVALAVGMPRDRRWRFIHMCCLPYRASHPSMHRAVFWGVFFVCCCVIGRFERCAQPAQ